MTDQNTQPTPSRDVVELIRELSAHDIDKTLPWRDKEDHYAWSDKANDLLSRAATVLYRLSLPAQVEVTDEMVQRFIQASSIASGDTNQCVRAALTATLSTMGARSISRDAKAGWRPLPVEPDDGMIEAGEEEIACRKQHGMGVFAADIYEAMVAAAPDIGGNT